MDLAKGSVSLEKTRLLSKKLRHRGSAVRWWSKGGLRRLKSRNMWPRTTPQCLWSAV